MEQKENSKSKEELKSKDELQFKQTDLAAILKGSLAISEQLLPEKLSETLMQVVMKESGASKGNILFEFENKLSIVAEAVLKNGIEIKYYTELNAPDYNFLPENIIQLAKNTNEQIIINDVSTDKVYGSNKYIISAHPKSIACIPIVKDTKNVGMIYLEHVSGTNVFTPEKIVALKILATQAAVSFENMVLFNTLVLSKKRFQDIMDNSTALVFAKLLNGKYLFINNEFEKIHKVNREKVIAFTDFEIFPKKFAESYLEKDKIIIETQKSITYEEVIPHGNTMHTYIIAKFPLRDSDGKFYAIGGIATDITELKNMEETLKENQDRFNYVLAATHDAIYDWDFVSGRIWRNEQYEKLFAGPTGPGLEWWKNNIHPEEFIDISGKLVTAFSKQDQFWNQEYRFKNTNQGYVDIIDRGFIIYDNQKKPLRMIGALMDISDLKKAVEVGKKRSLIIIERQSELLRLNSSLISLPINEKLKKIIESDAKTLGVERVSIQLFDHDRISIISENTFLLSKSEFVPGISLLRKDYPRYFLEMEFNKIVDANNAATDPRTSELAENYFKQNGITSIMNISVKLKGKIIGIVCHEHVGPVRIWTYEEMVFANSIADIVSLTFEIHEREKIEDELKKLKELLENTRKVEKLDLMSAGEMA